jgi:hypothetical protein
MVQFARSSTIFQSVNQAHNSSMSKICSDIILSIQIASVVPLPRLNPH